MIKIVFHLNPKVNMAHKLNVDAKE
jgi:hypothetical protein